MTTYFRRVITITAEDSPNVLLGLREKSLGLASSNTVVVPGVLTYAEYLKRLATWDPIRICVGLRAQFYEGADVMLYPREWLAAARSEELATICRAHPAEAIGVDPGEGFANTAWCAVNRYGLKERVSKKTPNTAVIKGETLAFMRKHNLLGSPDKVAFDRGGGGKQIADELREMGYGVRTVAFGESLAIEPRRGMTRIEDRIENREERYAYTNRRAEMYGELRILLDPSRGILELLPDSAGDLGGFHKRPAAGGLTVSGTNTSGNPLARASIKGFSIPAEYDDVYQQLSPIPLSYDGEGRLFLLPKTKKHPEDTGKTLTEIIGHSPDEADALVLGCHAMLHKKRRMVAGAVG